MGDRFTHAHYTTEDRTPLECRVTAVREGRVHWRPSDGGPPMHFGVAATSRYVREHLPREAPE